MARKIVDDVDGFTVDGFAGTFSGKFKVEGSDARYMAYDDEVLMVVKVRVKMPRFTENAKGEFTRVNVLRVDEAAIVRSDPLRKHLCETFGFDQAQAQQLPLDTSFSSQDVLPEDLEEENTIDVEVVQQPNSADGPKVAKFNLDDDWDPAAPAETVGMVRPGARSDKKLERFLQETQ